MRPANCRADGVPPRISDDANSSVASRGDWTLAVCGWAMAAGLAALSVVSWAGHLWGGMQSYGEDLRLLASNRDRLVALSTFITRLFQ
jgi:hypothetical protein